MLLLPNADLTAEAIKAGVGHSSTKRHSMDGSLLGKRKRQEASSTGDRAQARIDHYFASKAAVRKPTNDNNDSSTSAHVVHALQVRCDSALSSQIYEEVEAGQSHVLNQPQHSGLSRHVACETSVAGASSDQITDMQPPLSKESKHEHWAEPPVQAIALRINRNPHPAGHRALKTVQAVQQPASSATAKPDLSDHLSAFLAALPQRQQFRE